MNTKPAIQSSNTTGKDTDVRAINFFDYNVHLFSANINCGQLQQKEQEYHNGPECVFGLDRLDMANLPDMGCC